MRQQNHILRSNNIPSLGFMNKSSNIIISFAFYCFYSCEIVLRG